MFSAYKENLDQIKSYFQKLVNSSSYLELTKAKELHELISKYNVDFANMILLFMLDLASKLYTLLWKTNTHCMHEAFSVYLKHLNTSINVVIKLATGIIQFEVLFPFETQQHSSYIASILSLLKVVEAQLFASGLNAFVIFFLSFQLCFQPNQSFLNVG